MGKSIKEEVEAVEQTIRERVVEALAASGLNVQLKHAENIAHRIEAIVEGEVAAIKTRLGIVEQPASDEDAGA